MGIYFDTEEQADALERAKGHFRKKDYLEGMYLLSSILGASCVTDHHEALELGCAAYEWANRCFNYVVNAPETSLRDKSMIKNVHVQIDMMHAKLMARHKKD